MSSNYFNENFEGNKSSQKGSSYVVHFEGNVKVLVPSLMEINSTKMFVVNQSFVRNETPLPAETTIQVEENSRVTLLLTNGTSMVLKEKSKLKISQFQQEEFTASEKRLDDQDNEISSSFIKLDLELGDLVVDVKKLNKHSRFIIDSPVGATGIRGTQFGLNSTKKETILSVREGEVDFLENDKNIVRVRGGESLTFSGLHPPSVTGITKDKSKSLNDSITLALEQTAGITLNEIYKVFRFGNQLVVETSKDENWHKGKKFDRGAVLSLQTNEWGGTIHLFFDDDRIRKDVAPLQAKLLVKVGGHKHAVSKNVGKVYYKDKLIGTVPKTFDKDRGQWVETRLDAKQFVSEGGEIKLVIKPTGPNLLSISGNKSNSKPKLLLVY